MRFYYGVATRSLLSDERCGRYLASNLTTSCSLWCVALDFHVRSTSKPLALLIILQPAFEKVRSILFPIFSMSIVRFMYKKFSKNGDNISMKRSKRRSHDSIT